MAVVLLSAVALWLTVSLLSAAAIGLTVPSAEVSPHLGYGVNLRYLSNVDTVFAPLGFDWVKVYERFDSMPAERLPYHVLYRIDVNHGDRWIWIDSRPYRPDLARIRADVRQIALDGLGKIDAYEIGNEPNMDWEWMDQAPDPADFVAVLRAAYEEIKAVDPGAIVVSGGIGPVGRIGGPTGAAEVCSANSGETYLGNNCRSMDERIFAREMFARGAGNHFDAFGYHPFGFAYEPERSLADLPSHDNGNGFAFRGAEAMRSVMVEFGLADKPIWATEYGWLRHPGADGEFWCYNHPDFAAAKWYALSESDQADYLVRSFQFADENWPWMGAMFIWAFDFHNVGARCWPGTYFSIRKFDGTDQGGGSLAYDALIPMSKRPGHFGPILAVDPERLTFLADVDEPSVQYAVLRPRNTGYRTLAWTATVSSGLSVTPVLSVASGLQDEPLTVTVDTSGYVTGVYAGALIVSATAPGVADSPVEIAVTLRVIPDVARTFVPIVLRASPH